MGTMRQPLVVVYLARRDICGLPTPMNVSCPKQTIRYNVGRVVPAQREPEGKVRITIRLDRDVRDVLKIR